MTSPRPRGPYAKGRERRREILRVALEAYAEAGPRGVPLKEIALRAGVTEAGLLHHFGSKEALLSAVLQARDAAAVDALGDVLDAHHLRRLVRYNSTTPGLVRLFVDVVTAASRPDHPAHEEFRERYGGILTSLEQSLTAQLDAAAAPATGRAAPAEPLADPADGPLDDPAWMSRILVAAMDGLQVQWLLDGDTDMAADISRLHTALLAVAARARAGAPAPPADPVAAADRGDPVGGGP